MFFFCSHLSHPDASDRFLSEFAFIGGAVLVVACLFLILVLQLSGILPGAAFKKVIFCVILCGHFQCDKATHNINQTDVTYLLTGPPLFPFLQSLEVDQGLLQSWRLCSHKTTRRLFSTAVLVPRMHVPFATLYKNIGRVWFKWQWHAKCCLTQWRLLLQGWVLGGVMKYSKDGSGGTGLELWRLGRL